MTSKPLKFHSIGDDRLQRQTFLVYGEPGIGKTRSAETLPVKDWSRFLYVPGDPGYLSISHLPITSVFIPYESGTPSELLHYLQNEGRDAYDWVFIDGLDKLSEKVLRQFRAAVATQAKPDMRKLWGEFGDAMRPWIEGMRDLPGPSVVFTCHESRDEEAAIPYGPDYAGGKVGKQLVGMFDYVFHMRLGRLTEKGPMQRVFMTNRDKDPRYAVKARMPKGKELPTFIEADLGKVWRMVFGAEK